MARNIFLEIEYMGIGYFGFQVQNKKGVSEITVQEVIEQALEKFFKQKIRIIYASRTDRGVHAKAQAINFTVDTNIPLKNFKTALNDLLPPDIRIRKVKSVPSDFHSRFSVKSKIYRYIIFNKREPSVFWHNFSWHMEGLLNIGKMQKTAQKITGRFDCSIFAKEAKNYKSCVREIKNISFKRKNSFLYIDIEADGFLRNMARNIVSFLVRVGRDKVNLEDAFLILEGRKHYINKPAPAQGLYLWKIKY